MSPYEFTCFLFFRGGPGGLRGRGKEEGDLMTGEADCSLIYPRSLKLGSLSWLSPWQVLDSVLSWRAGQIPFHLYGLPKWIPLRKLSEKLITMHSSSWFPAWSEAPLPTRFSDSWDFQTCTKWCVVCTFLQPMLMRATVYIVLLMCFHAVRDFHLLIHQVHIIVVSIVQMWKQRHRGSHHWQEVKWTQNLAVWFGVWAHNHSAMLFSFYVQRQ